MSQPAGACPWVIALISHAAGERGETASWRALQPVRVRDVEIALVLAREMKDAAARDVDASLRLDQLKEVFGADQLDGGGRGGIEPGLRRAGLERRPSVREAGAEEPIRFEVSGDEA